MATAQKTILLEENSSYNKTVNLRGSELYVFVDDFPKFIPKTGEFEFRTTRELDSLLLNAGSNADSFISIKFLVRTSHYDYQIHVYKKYYIQSEKFKISIMKPSDNLHYGLDLDSLDKFNGYEFISTSIQANPNELWKGKFYK